MSAWWHSVTAYVVAALLVLVAISCGNPPESDVVVPTGGRDGVVTIALDSEWVVPAGFTVILPMTNDRVAELLRNDPGNPPDLPEFTMDGEIQTVQGQEGVVISVYSDGIITEADAETTLISWSRSFRDAVFGEIVMDQGNTVQWATVRGSVHSPAQDTGQGAILTVIADSGSNSYWRVACITTTNEFGDEVTNVCEQITDSFRPLPAGPIPP